VSTILRRAVAARSPGTVERADGQRGAIGAAPDQQVLLRVDVADQPDAAIARTRRWSRDRRARAEDPIRTAKDTGGRGPVGLPNWFLRWVSVNRLEGFVVGRFAGRSAGTPRLGVRPIGGDVFRTTTGALAHTQRRLRIQVRRRDSRAFLIGDRSGRAGRRSILGVERLVRPLLAPGAETSFPIVIRRRVDLHLFGSRTGA
jgi:hypothetical protein